VSKSFAVASEKGGPIEGVDTVNISIASYRVIEVREFVLVIMSNTYANLFVHVIDFLS
jgi:hypothetical protein